MSPPSERLVHPLVDPRDGRRVRNEYLGAGDVATDRHGSLYSVNATASGGSGLRPTWLASGGGPSPADSAGPLSAEVNRFLPAPGLRRVALSPAFRPSAPRVILRQQELAEFEIDPGWGVAPGGERLLVLSRLARYSRPQLVRVENANRELARNPW